MAPRFVNMPLVVGERTYTLRFGVNALIALQDELGQSLDQLVKRVQGDSMAVSLRDLRVMLWSGLVTHHAGITLAQAGEIIDDAGMEVVAKALNEAVQASSVQEPSGNPPVAVGTGPAS